MPDVTTAETVLFTLGDGSIHPQNLNHDHLPSRPESIPIQTMKEQAGGIRRAYLRVTNQGCQHPFKVRLRSILRTRVIPP